MFPVVSVGILCSGWLVKQSPRPLR